MSAPRLLCLAALLTGTLAQCAAGDKKPDFSGLWATSSADSSEIVLIRQSADQVRIIMFVDDSIGKRILDVKGPLDGSPQPQTVDGSPCTFMARWDGNSLAWETRRDTAAGVLHNRRAMTLSDDGNQIAAHRTRLSPSPTESFDEKWERQDRSLEVTPFTFRDLIRTQAGELTKSQLALARGAQEVGFRDMKNAQRDLLDLIRKNPGSREASDARELLETGYQIGGQVRRALAQCTSDCGFLKSLSHYPEMSVAHRGHATLTYSTERDGRVRIPVTAGGQERHYLIDTGSNMSLMSVSEARRLGLQPQSLSKRVNDAGGGYTDTHLAILPRLIAGRTELRDVPFWVMDDKPIDDDGILGIDVLLALDTLRWDRRGAFEIGFPPAKFDIFQSNICFEGWDPVIDASFDGQPGLAFFLDTGLTDSTLGPAFAARFPDAMVQGRQDTYQIDGYVGRKKMRQLVLPEAKVDVGGWGAPYHPATILLKTPPIWGEKAHGVIGIDLLKRARKVTLDFHAMRLTVE